jgi:hypothetical protein
VLAQEIDLRLDHHGMNDAFELLQSLGVTGDLLPQQLSVDPALACNPGECVLDRRDCLAFIEAMHARVGIKHWDAAAGEMFGGCRLPHADPAGKPDDQHQAPPSVAATWAFSSFVTCGRTPNQRSKPGTA